MSQRIIDNLKELIKAVEERSDHLFNLNAFCCEEECGTLYCTAGLAATMPFFQKQGMTLVECENDVRVGNITIFDADGNKECEEMFGEKPYSSLFVHCGGSPIDAEFPQAIPHCYSDGYYAEVPEGTSHKELALFRLRAQLAKYENAHQ